MFNKFLYYCSRIKKLYTTIENYKIITGLNK
jgi:hypothetical protein